MVNVRHTLSRCVRVDEMTELVKFSKSEKGKREPGRGIFIWEFWLSELTDPTNTTSRVPVRAQAGTFMQAHNETVSHGPDPAIFAKDAAFSSTWD